MKEMGLAILMGAAGAFCATAASPQFNGKYFAGDGDTDYVQLLETAARMYYPDPEIQNISMLYTPAWNGFVEGPTWGAWWIQNSYGPTYCSLPFFIEPYTTFIQNSQDLWFNQMGDGKRKGANDWVAPDGCLCDAASPNWIVYKQGDGRTDIHDWGMEFTAAGVVLQSELLLISRDPAAIAHYLPMLERSADFIESRRDPKNNLFLAGPAGNLLAPSYAAWKKPDGTYDKAYLAGLSITYIAGLDRLIELEKMAGNPEKAARYAERRDLAKKGLPALTTDEGYFIKYLDPDGTKHGVYGAPVHGYFEAICNHDAIAFRVVDDAQARKIYEKIVSIPGLRRHDVIITNCPGLDDTYEPTESGLWSFGTWVNGGHWTTCEARMMMGYCRLGAYDDARRSMKHILEFAKVFRLDNNLVDFGAKPYQPNQPINCVYDSWGAPAALIRGLFEYLYKAEGLTLLPHIPTGITRLEQRFPIRFGAKRLYLSTSGNGPVTSVNVNGKSWKQFDGQSVFLAYDETPEVAMVSIGLGGAAPTENAKPTITEEKVPPRDSKFWDLSDFAKGLATNTLPLRIGADSDGKNGFMGDMRRVRVFDRALSAKEIAALAKSSETPVDIEGLVADYAPGNAKDGKIVINGAGSGLTAKIVNKVDVVESAGEKQFRFSGDGCLDVAHDARLGLANAFTFDAWIRPQRLPEGGARIIDKVAAGTDRGYTFDTCPGNSLRLITPNGALSLDAKLEPGVWRHVAASFDAKGELRLYVGGKQVAATPAKSSTSKDTFARIGAFCAAMREAGLAETYEARHAQLVVDYVAAMHAREKMKVQGKIVLLPEPSQSAADLSYLETATKLVDGLAKTILSYEGSGDSNKKQVLDIWKKYASN